MRPETIDSEILKGIAGALAAGEKLTAADTLPRFGCMAIGRYMTELQRRHWRVASKIITIGDDRYMEYHATAIGDEIA